MAQDEHTSRCSNSSSGGGGGGAAGGGGGSGGGGGGGSSHRSSKKLKHKKVPQRGMGVAQLEKIISEEQQKKDVSILTSNSIISPSNSSSNLATISKIPNFRQPPPPPPPISSSSIPLPPPLPPNHHHPLISKTDSVNPISSMGGGGGGGGGGSSNWCRLWSDGDYSFEGEKQNHNHNHNQNQSQNHGLDHPRYSAAFQANLGGLPYESNPPPIWPPPTPNLMLQRSQHLQQPCSSSMVNVSTGTSSSSSSSVMNLQMEPPSNQSYCGNNNNNYQPLWPEEEKMVGMKRPYPFSLENVPIPSFHCKFPSAYIPSIPRSDESASCSNGGTISIEPAHPTFRETPLSSGAINDTITKKFIDENQGLTRDFLKLAPPQPQLISKEKLHSSPCIGEQSQFETLSPHKGQSKDSTHFSGRGVSNPQPFISFFLAAKTPMGQAGNSNGEAGENVDLNLKL